MRKLALVVGLVLLPAFAAQGQSSSVADFYRGKQIRIIVGTAPGDYDTWMRMIARHMRQYVPGNPNFVVENMPGAGSLRAANFIYSAAPKDGTAIATFSRTMPMMGVLGGNDQVVAKDRLGALAAGGDVARELVLVLPEDVAGGASPTWESQPSDRPRQQVGKDLCLAHLASLSKKLTE